MVVVLIASISMVIEDVVGTIMVQAEAANRGWLAGLMDAIGWGVGLASTFISIDALQGHNFDLKLAVIIGVTIANVLGTKLGQIIGMRLLGSKKVRMFFAKGNRIEPTLQERIAYLENVCKINSADAFDFDASRT